ncbi:MAG: O-antigen ligase family protein [Minisyncoccia bacterium]|jgi:O-antigen ligase
MDYLKISKLFLKISVLCVAIVTVSTLFPFIVGKYSWFRASVDIALVFFCLGLIFQRNLEPIWDQFRRMFRSPLVWMVTLFIAVFLLACLFGVNPHWSFWSNFERGEGGFQMVHLYVFFFLLVLLFREEKDWQSIMKWFLTGGFLMVLYGVAAGFKWSGFVGPAFGDSGYRFQGSIGNPAYVAIFAVFMVFYCLYLLFNRYRQNLKSAGAITLFVLLAVFLATFFAAATRGTFVGLIAAIVVFLGYFAYSHKAWRKRALLAGIVIITFVVIMGIFKDTKFVQSIPGSRVFDLSVTAQTFSDRVKIWNMAWNGFLARPVLGWGPENFIQVFYRYFTPDFFSPSVGFGAWFDRAHSFIFDYLAETGALGFLSFAGIFVAFFWKFFRSQSQDAETSFSRRPLLERSLIFALPVAYLVQGLVLFDVLPIYMNIFFFMAFAVYLFQSDQSPKKNSPQFRQS